VKSVSDQAVNGLQVHHHVQDGASTDGTAEWLEEYAKQVDERNDGYSFSYESTSDEGMYHAINQGWDKTPDDYDYIAYINCDEQYLPGGLFFIAETFALKQTADVILATNIVVDGDGNYLCHRRAVKPYLWSARIWTASSACSTFMRRSVYFEHNGGFDTTWSIVGDMVWYVDLLKSRLNFHISPVVTSVFFDDGNNLAMTSKGIEELNLYRRQCVGWKACFTNRVRQFNTFRRILADLFLKSPKEYRVYRGGTERETLRIEQPTNLWKRQAI
jgi:glycosyltransferase involved in cell wall biosynthesis